MASNKPEWCQHSSNRCQGSATEGFANRPSVAREYPETNLHDMKTRGSRLKVRLPHETQPKIFHPQGRVSSLVSAILSLLITLLTQFSVLLSSLRSLLSTRDGSYTRQSSCLEYAPKGCPKAYASRLGTNPQRIKQQPFLKGDSIDQSSGRAGPTGQHSAIVSPAGRLPERLMDYVPTRVVNGHHPAQYFQRPSGELPAQGQPKETQQQPRCLVLVGQKESSNKHLKARVSWCPGELVSLSTLRIYIKQGYIAFSYTFKISQKNYLHDRIPFDGRGYVVRYHIETTFLHYMEKTPPSKIISAFDLMMSLCHELSVYLKNGKLPHYFFPECDLLAKVGQAERQIALQAIQDIICNPLDAILKSPTAPHQLFGDVSSEELIAAFHHVSTHPLCGQARNDLIQLLARLDEWRAQHYHDVTQIDRAADESFRVADSPDVRLLVDMLDRIWVIYLFVVISHYCMNYVLSIYFYS